VIRLHREFEADIFPPWRRSSALVILLLDCYQGRVSSISTVSTALPFPLLFCEGTISLSSSMAIISSSDILDCSLSGDGQAVNAFWRPINCPVGKSVCLRDFNCCSVLQSHDTHTRNTPAFCYLLCYPVGLPNPRSIKPTRQPAYDHTPTLL